VNLDWLVERLLTHPRQRPPGPVRPVATVVAGLVWFVAGWALTHMWTGVRERLDLPWIVGSPVILFLIFVTGHGVFLIVRPLLYAPKR
jgi:hypothetical protein